MSKLITEEYRDILKKTHAEGKWGNTGAQGGFFRNILFLANRFKAKEILDYGAGWGGVKIRMAKERPDIAVYEYEPARDEVSALATPRKFVICIDVLEHIEPDCLEAVLEDIARLTIFRGYLSIATEPAHRILTDGRNAHLIVEEPEWWAKKLKNHFNLVQQRPEKGSCSFVIKPKIV